MVMGDTTSDVLDGSFNVVLMIDVVEHIVEETKLDFAMQNVDRCLAPGGVFVLALPSVWSLAQATVLHAPVARG